MDLWLYLHFPALQLDSMLPQTETQREDFRIAPVIVVDGQQNSVVQLNSAAQERGIATGMGLATAASLCRDLQVLPYRPEQERAKLREVAHWLYDVSAEIALREPCGLILRVSRMLNYYRGLTPYWDALRQRLDALGYHYDYATAYSPLAARLLALSGHREISDHAEQLGKLCATRSLKQTDLSSAQQEQLARVGISQLGDLLAVPLKALSRRFSLEVLNYVGQLTGELKYPLEFYHPAENFQHYLELLYEIENTQVLQHPLTHQLKLLEAFLRRRDQVCTRIHFRLHQRDCDALAVKVGSAQGEYQAESWLELTRLTLEQCQLAAPVYALTLEVSQFQTKDAQRQDLFAGRQGKLSDRQLVSILQARLGEAAVTGLSCADDHRPELATEACAPLNQKPSAPSSRSALLRPSLLLPEPRELDEPVAIIHGPERIATGWWDQRPLVRDYYIARTKDGQWYWVFRTPASAEKAQRWYLHGYFS